MNVSALKNLQSFVHRTVKQPTGRFSVMYRRLEMPLMSGRMARIHISQDRQWSLAKHKIWLYG